jgi:Tol biopolymer transport system component
MPMQVPISGGEPEVIPTPFKQAELLDLSPDGAKLLVRVRDDAPDISEKGYPLYTLSAYGTSPHRLGNVTALCARWSPNGKMIAFTQGGALFVASADGSQTQKMGEVTSGYVKDLTWSPQGKRIRFVVRDMHNETYRLWEMRPGEGQPVFLLPDWKPQQATFSAGAWTVDGKFYVFDHGGELWALDESDGWLQKPRRKPIQLTSSPMFLDSLLIGKHGRRIDAVGSVNRAELLRVDPASGQFTPFLPGTSARVAEASPD